MGALPATSQISFRLEKPWRKPRKSELSAGDIWGVVHQVWVWCQWGQIHPWVSEAMRLELRCGLGRQRLSLTLVLHFTSK